jgi:hypothetical protein
MTLAPGSHHTNKKVAANGLIVLAISLNLCWQTTKGALTKKEIIPTLMAYPRNRLLSHFQQEKCEL